MRRTGTLVRGIRAPIVKEGDDVVEVVIESLKASWEAEGYSLKDGDVVGITESLIARAQGNYVTVDDIAADIKSKFGDEVGVVFPILSRNRFALILKGIARGCGRVYVLLSYPADEVGNHLMDPDMLEDLGINPYTDVLSEEDYRKYFGPVVKHKFTGIDYVSLYKALGNNDNISIYLANNPRAILRFTDRVLVCDIHSRHRTRRKLEKAGAKVIYGLDDICTQPQGRGGYNSQYGLLGSNTASDEKLKLFPRDGQMYVESIQKRLKELTGKQVEVMIYGDGAFKDPVGKIWELADPVVSPAYTSGLKGTPNEVKLKYIVDNQLKEMEGDSAGEAIKERIRQKKKGTVCGDESMGTTPRQLTDLLGSLCDLTSGSGDKGTPIVLIQGYFDNYASE
ncbi:MAG TPA: F420-0--gamma-glutamyl ligase [Clostridiales bacterium]|nr:F420-0--gamma-glutamyl ligase [Clostridiales bacterium]